MADDKTTKTPEQPVTDSGPGNPIVKGQYGEATNPIFKVFYLENAHGVIADFSGNPPYEF